jgi:DNA-binding NarL/FixJ family response regulator
LDSLISILLVEDENLVRQGVGSVLSRQQGMRVLAEAATVDEAIAAIEHNADIDVVVADVMLGNEPGGLRLLDALSNCTRRPPVLLLSSYDEPWMYASALRGGALGYVLKGASLHELTTAIRSVAAGVAVFPAAALRDRYANRLPSARERDIMRLVADGFGNGEIGGQLGIKEKTVESHLTRLFARYGVGSRTELALLASRQGWIGRRTLGSR